MDNSLPNFQLFEDLPDISLVSLKLENFMAFENIDLNFCNSDKIPKKFVCFIGDNGCGKTTLLDSVQLVFSRFDSFDQDRLVNHLGSLVRHVDATGSGIYGVGDFKLFARIKNGSEEYDVEINKNGFVKNHSDKIKELLGRICYNTRFDMELNTFQLERTKWEMFKNLFESITGYEVSETESLFDQSEDLIQAEMLRKYILGFTVKKPNETINHNECSAGERKIIKSFSTLLNKEYTPRIILIDNIEMHIAASRHINVIESIQKCFPNSQVFSTTHSYNISKHYDNKGQIYDLRLIKQNDLIRNKPWRLYLIDEIKESLVKLEGIKNKDMFKVYMSEGLRIISQCQNDLFIKQSEVLLRSGDLLYNINKLYLSNIMEVYDHKIM